MEPLLSSLLPKAAPRAGSHSLTWHYSQRSACRPWILSSIQKRTMIERKRAPIDEEQQNSYAQPAPNLSQDVSQEEKDHYDNLLKTSKTKQNRSPWTREGSDVPPVRKDRSAGAMTKGKLLTTPSRMLKLILPMTIKDTNKDRKDIEPLALLVHPQQPLSYLGRLIQSELPEKQDGTVPHVVFKAENSPEDEIDPDHPGKEIEAEDEASEQAEDPKAARKRESGPEEESTKESEQDARFEPPDDDHPNFVRWSPSTEIGDFIRDASRGKEFSVEIEGAPDPIYVGVPSFADRTFYLRMRLRKTCNRIAKLADIKKECDALAHKGGQRMAQAGFVGLVAWWYLVYRLTFETSLGWDVMEPVTYLVSMAAIIAGYTWFLYHNREVSYRSAMNFTISRRQNQLYQQKGLDVPTWEGLVEEANRLRREVKMVADEYDVEWDEKKEEGSKKVIEALRTERRKKAKRNEEKKDKDDEGDDD